MRLTTEFSDLKNETKWHWKNAGLKIQWPGLQPFCVSFPLYKTQFSRDKMKECKWPLVYSAFVGFFFPVVCESYPFSSICTSSHPPEALTHSVRLFQTISR